MKQTDSISSFHRGLELNFRESYGKLFASLLAMFGSAHIDLIEDAIQNSFYKALKGWKPDKMPTHTRNWLFIAARNDLLNQLKQTRKKTLLDDKTAGDFPEGPAESDLAEDPRLNALHACVGLSRLKRINDLSQVIFTLKNVCGFSVTEISACLLMSEDAVYKNHQRTKSVLKNYSAKELKNLLLKAGSGADVPAIERIIYAIFNRGYDTLDKDSNTPVNEDVCLEALSLAKLLYKSYGAVSTSNLVALFCFHLARMPARYKDGKLVPFLEQDPACWDNDLLNAAFHFMQEPGKPDRYYLEALIASKYMTTPAFTQRDWNDVITCYDALLQISDSAVIRMNRAYCFHKAGMKSEALKELKKVAAGMPAGNLYYSLMMGELLKEEEPENADRWLKKALTATEQPFRKEHIKGLIKK